MKITYRPAGRDDYGFIVVRLARVLGKVIGESRTAGNVNRTASASALLHGSTVRVVAETDAGALVGFHLEHDKHALCTFVVEELRRQGIGARLRNHGKAQADQPTQADAARR